MKNTKEPKKTKSYFWEILGLLFGISMFFISINFDEKQHASGQINYNDEGLVHFQSYWRDAFFGLLIVLCSVISTYYKKKTTKKS